MSTWTFSRYSAIIEGDNGDFLLHNSFMGAIAYIPQKIAKKIKRFIKDGIEEGHLSDRHLKELCDQGFFVTDTINEQKIVENLINKERESNRLGLFILPTEKCNFRCIYCYEKYENGKMSKNTIEAVKKFLQKNITKIHKLNVSWFGGEPLLALDVLIELSDYFIEKCSKNEVQYSSDISTNGYLLTPNIADDLLARQITVYQITLDGPREIHNNNRKLINGKKTYDKILHNLVEMHNRQEQFVIKIRINYDNKSIFTINEWIKDEIEPLFLGDPRFLLGFHPIGQWGGKNDPNLDICNSNSIQKISADYIINSENLGFSDNMIKRSLMPHGNVCYAAKKSSFVIGSDGTIYKCTVHFDDVRNIMGYLRKDGTLKINKEKWDLWTTIHNKDISHCKSCFFFPSCEGRSCPFTSIENNYPQCPISRFQYETMIKCVYSHSLRKKGGMSM